MIVRAKKPGRIPGHVGWLALNFCTATSWFRCRVSSNAGTSFAGILKYGDLPSRGQIVSAHRSQGASNLQVVHGGQSQSSLQKIGQ
jgi:hypothetical protein